jgi:streptogramin lyase
MLTNPTDGSPTNLQNLYNLAPAVGAPYQPTLTAVPSDWTIGVMYAATGNCANGGSFIQNANQLSIDVSGDLWISNGGGNLTELSPSGIPLTCQTIAGGGSAGSTIDVNGNIWIAAYSTNNIYRYSPSGGALLTYVTPYAPVGLTADGSGNLFFSTFSTPGVYLLANAANDTSGSQATPVQISSTVGSQPFQLMPDQNSNIWVSSYGNLISKVALNSTTPSSSVTTPFTTDTPSYGIAVTAKHGNDNYVYTAAASTTNDLTYLTGSGTSYSIAGGFPTAAGSAGLNNPLGIAVDGSQNVWAANNHTISSSLGSVSELSGSGAPLSPSTGFQKANTYFGANRSLAIDQSGNVWVGQDNSSTVSEVLGAAIPIYQPYSLGLHNGRFQSIP